MSMPETGRQATPRRQELRRGWTTGACATAAAKAAFSALAGLGFPDPVTIRLPKGQEPGFALLRHEAGPGWAMASVVKDAGDDPDVTDRAEIVVTLRARGDGLGLRFLAGEGVGTVTRAAAAGRACHQPGRGG